MRNLKVNRIFILAVAFFLCHAHVVLGNDEKEVGADYEDFSIDDDFYQSFEQIKIYDPYEKFNRSVYRFNRVIDRFIIEPPAKFYHYAFPSPVKRRVSSFVSNLSEPLKVICGVVQLKPKVAFDSGFRFFMNSIFGVFGIFDVATLAGLKKQDVSFGSVLKYYSANEGPYLILPIIGPSTMRRAVGTGIDMVLDPVAMLKFKNHIKFRNYYYGTRIVIGRESVIGIGDMISKGSFDEYATLRSFYYQNLASKLKKTNKYE